MSSKNKIKKTKRTSTARQLQFVWLGKLFSLFLLFDIVIATMVVWFGFSYIENVDMFSVTTPKGIYTEDTSIGNDSGKAVYFQFTGNDAGFAVNAGRTNTYVVRKENYEIEITDITKIRNALQVSGIILLAFEGVVMLWQLLFGIYPIRRKLKSLDEMAAKAVKLGDDQGLDELKVHNLEDAISKINPTTKDQLHSNDSELTGLENAINELLERTRESYRQQTRFVSDASHELRTPIAVIQGYANMLDRWGKDDEKVLDEGIEAIKNESEQMKMLVEQLLFLARGDSGRNKFNMENVNLNDIVKEVYEESLMIDEKHIYKYRECEEEVLVYGDAAMLKQTVRILTDNAAKYTEEKQPIKLGTGIDENKRPFFYVQDNGIGMEEREAEHAFERFYRADEARNSSIKGTGLGLSIAKWIVDQHKGFFTILTRKEIGTRITVTFN